MKLWTVLSWVLTTFHGIVTSVWHAFRSFWHASTSRKTRQPWQYSCCCMSSTKKLDIENYRLRLWIWNTWTTRFEHSTMRLFLRAFQPTFHQIPLNLSVFLITCCIAKIKRIHHVSEPGELSKEDFCFGINGWDERWAGKELPPDIMRDLLTSQI